MPRTAIKTVTPAATHRRSPAVERLVVAGVGDKALPNLRTVTDEGGTAIVADARRPAPEFAEAVKNLGKPVQTELDKWVADCWHRGRAAAGPMPGAAK